jgi:hypothetical protein
MNKHFVAFVDFNNDFGIPEQRLAGPYELDRAEEVKSDLKEAGGIGNVSVLQLDTDPKSFPLMNTGDRI